jgi:hypothetical protein
VILLYACICILAVSSAFVGHSIRGQNFLSAWIFGVSVINSAGSIIMILEVT